MLVIIVFKDNIKGYNAKGFKDAWFEASGKFISDLIFNLIWRNNFLSI